MKKYVRTKWVDHIIDTETNEVLQEGTRFTANRANNIENGIYNIHGQLVGYDDELTKLRIQLEMIGRAPTNNGTFFDPIGDEGQTKALKLMSQSALAQERLASGVTGIIVDDAKQFAVGQSVTVLDNVNNESRVIESISGNKLTVSALTHSYKKGAYVMRSSAFITNNQLTYSEWGTYGITAKEVI